MTNHTKAALLSKIQLLEQEKLDRDRTIIAMSREVRDVNNALSKIMASVAETDLGSSNFKLNEMVTYLREAAAELSNSNPTLAAIIHVKAQEALEYLKVCHESHNDLVSD